MRCAAPGALLAATVVSAANIIVNINTFDFDPAAVTAAAGDVIIFVFLSEKHTVTQSTFGNPCAKSGTIDSGLLAASEITFEVAVNDTQPLWFHCSNHCRVGMVFAVNPTAENTFAQFQKKAYNMSSHPLALISSASASPESSPSSTSSTSSNSTSTSASTSSTGGSVHPHSSVSGSTSSSFTDAPSNHHAKSSQNNGTIVGAVLAGVALIVIVLVFFLFRRRSKSREKQAPMAQPLRVEFNASSTEPCRDDASTSHLPWQLSAHSESQQVLAVAPNSGNWSATQGGSQPVSENNSALVTAPLLPVRRGQPVPLVGSSENQGEIRAIRQMEINQRLQSAQHQMDDLTFRQSMPPPDNGGVRSTAEDQEMENMREQIRMLKGLIESLQMERRYWEMGLSDEPPPAYA